MIEASPSEQLSCRVADVRDAAGLASVFIGSDAVVSTIGPDRNLSPGDLVSAGTVNILAACREAQVSRFVMQSGITVTDGSDLSFWDRCALRPIRLVYRKALADKRLAEAATQSSELDWIIVRPSGLKDAPSMGSYIAGPRARIALLRPLPFSDCADCLVRAASGEPGWSRQIVNVGV
jgi:nucleoside-diphosphate-sugar epimerase